MSNKECQRGSELGRGRALLHTVRPGLDVCSWRCKYFVQ